MIHAGRQTESITGKRLERQIHREANKQTYIHKAEEAYKHAQAPRHKNKTGKQRDSHSHTGTHAFTQRGMQRRRQTRQTDNETGSHADS